MIILSSMGVPVFGILSGLLSFSGIAIFGVALYFIIKGIKNSVKGNNNQNQNYNRNYNQGYNQNGFQGQPGQPGQQAQYGNGQQNNQTVYVNGQPYPQNRGPVDTRVGTGSANPYSSTYRYSYPGRQETMANAQTVSYRPADEPVKLSRREKRKLQKQAAKEAELAKARAAEQAKIDAEKKAEEQRKEIERRKKEQEQSLAEKYKVKKRERTGDSTIDKMLDEEERAIAEMRRLDDAIEDEKVSAQIVHLEDVTAKIVDFVVQHPNKKNQVKRFFNYYLPTAIKLLNSYDRMDDTGISGENIDATKEQVEAMMDKALEAFDKQLDSLYGDEALDVASDIKVMESLLAQEGLTDDSNITLKL